VQIVRGEETELTTKDITIVAEGETGLTTVTYTTPEPVPQVPRLYGQYF